MRLLLVGTRCGYSEVRWAFPCENVVVDTSQCCTHHAGQQGRTLLRKCYILDLDSLTWTRISNDSLPSARAGHAMVAIPPGSHNGSGDGSSGCIFLFGGQGKKMTNDLHRLDVETGQLTEMQPKGQPPLPRRGMTLTHDGGDSLICFGGTLGTQMDNALAVYSIQRNEWSHPSQHGTAPSPRTNHSAVLLSSNQVTCFSIGCCWLLYVRYCLTLCCQSLISTSHLAADSGLWWMQCPRHLLQ